MLKKEQLGNSTVTGTQKYAGITAIYIWNENKSVYKISEILAFEFVNMGSVVELHGKALWF